MKITWTLSHILEIFWKDFDIIAIENAHTFEKHYNELEEQVKTELDELIILDFNYIVGIFKIIEEVKKEFNLTNDFEIKKQFLLDNGYSLTISMFVLNNWYLRFKELKDFANKTIDVENVGKIDDIDLEKLETETNIIEYLLRIKVDPKIDLSDAKEYVEFVKNTKKLKLTSTKELTKDSFFEVEPKLLKNDTLKKTLIEYGFLNLSKVKDLSSENQQKLFEQLCIKNLPYCIALLDYLGFIKELVPKYFRTLDQRNIEMARWYNKKDKRSISGNINVLTDFSEDDRKRFTSHKYKENVKNDYSNIKLGIPL